MTQKPREKVIKSFSRSRKCFWGSRENYTPFFFSVSPRGLHILWILWIGHLRTLKRHPCLQTSGNFLWKCNCCGCMLTSLNLFLSKNISWLNEESVVSNVRVSLLDPRAPRSSSPASICRWCFEPTHFGIFPPRGSWWWNCSTRTVTTTDKPTIIMVLAKYWAERKREREGSYSENALLDARALSTL